MTDETVIGQPTLRINSDAASPELTSVSACGLAADFVASLASCARLGNLLKSVFRVTVAEVPSTEDDSLPDVAGRYVLLKDQVQFIPHFPFEKEVKYCASFDPRPLDAESRCPAARDFSRAYLHHLFKAGEALGGTLLSIVNLYYYQDLMDGARAAIAASRFDDFAAATRAQWTAKADKAARA